jgi:hypothetical protein
LNALSGEGALSVQAACRSLLARVKPDLSSIEPLTHKPEPRACAAAVASCTLMRGAPICPPTSARTH